MTVSGGAGPNNRSETAGAEWHSGHCTGEWGMTDWKPSRWAGEEHRKCIRCGGVQARTTR